MSSLPKIWLSKSTYLRGMQCQKSLYLYKNFYQLREKPSADQQARFDRGHRIGDLAQLLFPGGLNLQPKSPRGWPQSLIVSSKLVANAQPILYEAAFAREGVMCALDILVLNEEKLYDVYEVKSSPGVRQVYIEDMALQYWVLSAQKMKLGKLFLMTPKKHQDGYTDLKIEDMDIQEVTQQVAAMVLDVEERVRAAERTLQLEHAPEMPMGEHCLKPYPCDFQTVCRRQAENDY